MKINKNGFSLIELITIIIIIGIIIVGASKISFKSQIDNENTHLLVNTIYGNIETFRNNALLGKAVMSGSSLIHPNKWIIKATTVGSGSILGYYSTGGTLQKYGGFGNFNIPNSQLQELKCINIQNSTSFHTGAHIDIEILGGNISFSGCNAPENGILDIKFRHANTFKIIRFNSVTGLLEKR